MKAIVQEQFKAELRRAQIAIAEQAFETAWKALQRAHILGQRHAIAHMIVHWNMLQLAWTQRDFQEVARQLLPTVLAIPLTLLFGQLRSLRGGKAHVHDLEEMGIPEDIQRLLKQ